MDKKKRSVFSYINSGTQSNPVDKFGWQVGIFMLAVLGILFFFLPYWVSLIDTMISLLAAILVAIYWLQGVYEKGKMLEPILVNIKYKGKIIPLEYKPLRSDMSRAEIQGVLGLYFKRYDGHNQYNPLILFKVVVAEASNIPSKLNDVVSGRSSVMEVEVDDVYYKGYLLHMIDVKKAQPGQGEVVREYEQELNNLNDSNQPST